MTRRIHRIHEVRGKDGVGATMDSMELEKERGITIASAATYCQWGDHEINIIDTPGHVDFTIEVERALRVLDGAILVLCAVGGVQSQSITVDQQMKRYQVPCIAFVNKCDRSGADPFRVIAQLREKLHHNAVALQIPIGQESNFEGVIDLISMKAVFFDGDYGDAVRIEAIPADLLDVAREKRDIMIDAAAMFSDELTDAVLEEREISERMLLAAVRTGTLKREITPVLIGSAYKNKGIQTLLDAVTYFLPAPMDVTNDAMDIDDPEKQIILTGKADDPLVALAFKLEDGHYGQLSYIRLYQGELKKGDVAVNMRNRQKIKVGRIVRMHADQMEDVERISAGYIGAFFGIDCASGDTFAAPGLNLSMTSMFVPEPVISLAIKPVNLQSEKNMAKALSRFTKEDPTFRSFTNEETGETIISGMGELHLEIYLERMKREYQSEIISGEPRVAYRETVSARSEFNYTHKKQTGGSGQFGRISGYLEPAPDQDFVFENKVTGGSIPTQFISACEKGFKACLEKGPYMKYPVTGIKVVINDGASHAVDSSDIAFQAAARGSFLQGYVKASPILLEPIMKVVVETPGEFQGNVMGSMNQRRGIIIGAHDVGYTTVIESRVPLAEMFGYATVLRSLTQGKAQFTMEFDAYKQVPKSVLDKLQEKEEKRARTGT
jgi:elongation factor G